MITHISPREAELSRQIDEQGAQLEAWRDRAIAAEAELARLRAVEPVAWKHDCAGLCTNDVELWIDACPHCGKPRAAPPAQPAEPVQRLSDERAAFEAWHNEYRTQELVRRDDTYYNTHVRCRWEGWQARAIESALQPGWRDIESAPKDGLVVVHWLDDEDTEYPDRHDFDMLEDGIWTKHADKVEYANLVAPPGSRMPPQKAPYTGWHPLPSRTKGQP